MRADYRFEVADPVFSLPAGIYTEPQTLTIDCATEGATIRYTTDGSDPSRSHGTIYSGGIPLDETMNESGIITVKAYAYKGGFSDSETVSVKYNFPATYGTIYIGGTEITLPKCDYDIAEFHGIVEYRGLSWEWNDTTETGQLVMDNYQGTSIRQGSLKSINIRLVKNSNSRLAAEYSRAMYFSEGIIITGAIDAEGFFPVLRLESNYYNVLEAIDSEEGLQATDVQLYITGKHDYNTDDYNTCAVSGNVTLAGKAKLRISVERVPGSRNVARDIQAINGRLTMRHYAEAEIIVGGDNTVNREKYGVGDITLRGTGVCVIDIENDPYEAFPIRAVRFGPPVFESPYTMEGDWEKWYVKFKPD